MIRLINGKGDSSFSSDTDKKDNLDRLEATDEETKRLTGCSVSKGVFQKLLFRF